MFAMFHDMRLITSLDVTNFNSSNLIS
jgi:surface protein